MENVLSINLNTVLVYWLVKYVFWYREIIEVYLSLLECMRDEAASFFIFFKKIKIQRTARPEVLRGGTTKQWRWVLSPNFG
jgi:hypothetical protein